VLLVPAPPVERPDRPVIVSRLELLRKLAGSIWVRAAVSAGLLALVATQIDFGTLRGRLSGGSWGWFALGVVMLFASFVVGGVRWHVFLRAAEVGSTLRRAVDAYLIGAFTTNFLPTQVGGDVTRALVAADQGMRIRSATTVIVDRATALACMIVVGWLVIATNPAAVPGQLIGALAASSLAFVLACVAIPLVFRLQVIRKRLPARLRPAAAEIKGALLACLSRPVLVRTFLIGLGFQGLVYLSSWLVVRSISLPISFSVLGGVLAPVLILSAAPVSIGGFGVREGSFVFLLGYAGVSATDATLYGLLQGATFALASLPGALVLLRRRPRRAGLAGPAQAENREQEGREEDLQSGDHDGRGEQGDLALAERAGAFREPVDHDRKPADQPGDEDRATNE
jgi:uncharacterized protein (TIRG00374 family)